MPKEPKNDQQIEISEKVYKQVRDEICYTKEELHDWIKTYLDIDLPNCNISDVSNSNPMDMIWWAYWNAIHYEGNTSKKAMFVASRGGFKTLGASIVELLMVYHGERGVVHIGAILKTAERCYQYFQKYFRKNGFDDLLYVDPNGRVKQPIMKETTLKNGSTLEILPCTLSACNDPESIVLANGKETKVKCLKVGDELKSLDFDTLENSTVKINKIKKVKKPSFLIELENGSELICSDDHLLLTQGGWFSAKEINGKHSILCDKKTYKETTKPFFEQKNTWNKFEWQSFLVGKMLGDAHLSLNKKGEKIYGNPRIEISQSKKHSFYVDYCEFILSQHIKIKQKKNASIKGRFSDIPNIRLTSESTEKLMFLRDLFTNGENTKKIINPWIEPYINPISLAFWFMDDGSCNAGNIRLATCSFSKEENTLLIDLLKKKFQFTNLRIDTKKCISFSTKDSALFMDIIRPYVIPGLQYKLFQNSPQTKYDFHGNEIIRSSQNSHFIRNLPSHKDSRKYRKWRKSYKKINHSKVKNKIYLGEKDLISISVDSIEFSNKNFFCNGIIQHNCNGPHQPFVCIGGGTNVLIDNTNRIVSENRDRIQITMKKLVELIQSGKNINAISYNLQSKQIESKPILKAQKTGHRERLKIQIGTSKKTTLWCTEDHLLWSVEDNKYKPASKFNVGDKLLTPKKIPTQSLKRDYKEKEIINITKIPIKRDVFDITVKDNNNFFAGGVLVHNCLDEIDAVQDMKGYDDISGIPVRTKDGKPPIEIGISTMKSASGLVANEINNAKSTGLEVFYWNMIDLTKKCPDSRSGTKKIPIYANADTLEAISESEWKDRTESEQKNFEKHEGLQGCLDNCKIFAACLGNLKKQKCKSELLNDIDFTQQKIFSKSPEWVSAQLLCRKPSMEGVIYSRFAQKKNIHTYRQMYEVFTGQEWEQQRDCDFDDLRKEFEKAGIRPNMAVDFGDHLAVLLLIYTDGKDRVYVVKEKTFSGIDDAELAEWASKNWARYNIDMIYADPASPSGIRLLRKKNFRCHDKVKKDVWGGINTVRQFINVPGTQRSALFIHDSCNNLNWEMPRYSKKYNKSLNVFMDEPVKKNDHSLDALRYYLHTKYDGVKVDMFIVGQDKEKKGQRTKLPSIEDVAIENGVTNFNDNKDDFIKDPVTGKLRPRTDAEIAEDDDKDSLLF